MKKVLMLLFVSTLVSCSNDDGPKMTEWKGDDGWDNNGWMTFPEVTTEGKDVIAFKTVRREFISHNLPSPVSNSIPDSIAFVESWFRQDKVSKRYVFEVAAVDQKMEGFEIIYFMYYSLYPLKVGEKYSIVEDKRNGGDHPYHKNVYVSYNYHINDKERLFFDGVNGKMEIIKLDTVNNVISGIFHFEGKREGVNENIKITEGRFDLNYIGRD